MQNYMRTLMLTLSLTIMFQTSSIAADVLTSKEDAVTFVKRAIEFINRHGKERAFAEFNNAKGQFVSNELYIVVSDMNGVVLAHGTNPRIIGKNLMEIKDRNGKQFVKEEIKLIETKGKGWVDFDWINPVTQSIELRSTYVERVGNHFVAAGVYR